MSYECIKVIAFDFDDTLCNREKSAYRLYSDFLDKTLNLNNSLLKESILQDMMIHDQKGYVNKDCILKRIEEKYNICFSDISLTGYYRNNIDKFIELYDDTKETLNYLKQNYKLVIATNGFIDLQMNKITAKLDITLFDNIFISSMCGYHKPDLQFFKELEKIVQTNANEIVFIGDNFANDVMGPLNVGMKAIWFDNKSNASDYSGPKIKSLKELINFLR